LVVVRRHLRAGQHQAFWGCQAQVAAGHIAAAYSTRPSFGSMGPTQPPRRAPLGPQAIPLRHRHRRPRGRFQILRT
jgi:hypothetical protein